MSIEEYIREFNSDAGLLKLQELLVQRARFMFEARVRGMDDKKELFIRRTANALFLTAANIIAYYNDIIASLVDKKAGTYPSKTDPDHIITIIKSENEKQNCIGVTKQWLGNDRVHEFEQVYTTDFNYALEIFSHNKGGPIIIDLAARSGGITGTKSIITEEEVRDEYKRNCIPGSDKCARRLKISRGDETTARLITFEVSLRKNNDPTEEYDRKTWTLHQLENTVMHNLGLGFRNSKLVRDFLKLDEGQSFEDLEDFAWGTGDEEYLKKVTQHLKKKGWEGVPVGKWCDIDHFVGRSKIWMNSTLYTFACSHRWNRSMP